VTALNPDDPRAVLLTVEQAADAAHVRPETIWQWDSRGLLARAGEVDGRPLYAELDVLQAEAATRRRPRLRALLDEAINRLSG
jgi:hypothetical protein